MKQITLFSRPRLSVQSFPDTERYKGGFALRSESSNRLYKVSFDNAPKAKYWVCSCPGNIAHGECKHLRACGLRGRRGGQNLLEAQKYGWA